MSLLSDSYKNKQGRAHNSEHRESLLIQVRDQLEQTLMWGTLEMELITQLAAKFAEEQGAFKLLVRAQRLAQLGCGKADRPGLVRLSIPSSHSSGEVIRSSSILSIICTEHTP